MTISLVIPAYNEENRLIPFLNSVKKYHSRHPHILKEIIIVDDGSQDKTLSLAKNFQTHLPIIRVVSHSKNMGKGAAVRTGVLAARGDSIIFMDADGATDISELPKMIAALQEADIAIGNRWLAGSKTERHSNLRRLAGWLYRNYMKIFGLEL